MKRKTALPELLAPAGSVAAFYAAIHAGADAVYLGAPDFNARAYSDRLDAATLSSLISYAHMQARRVYVAMNTLLSDKELPAFLHAAREIRDMGADGVIVADIGGAQLIAKELPTLPLHASTQMSLHSSAGLTELLHLPFTRAVPARELSLSDVRTLVDSTPLEIEVFLHGALCVSHSGQCLFSSLVGGRSGNRGECAQPCRLPYNGTYPLSLSDLSLAAHITELLESGVASLKIEGRMKSPSYVYEVTSVYRRLLDEKRNATKEETARLSRAFSRSGFTDGYFTGKLASPMTGVRSESDKAESRTVASQKTPDTSPQKTALSAELCILLGMPSRLTLQDGRHAVTVLGATPTKAESLPLSEDALRSRMQKMGGTPFALAEDRIEITLENGLYLSPSEVNALRRDAISALSAAYRTPLTEEAPPKTLPPVGASEAPPLLPGKSFSAYCHDPLLLSVLPDSCEAYIPLFRLSEARALPDGVSLPPVLKDSELSELQDLLFEAKRRGVTRVMCENLGHLQLARACGMTPVGGFRLNICNKESLAFYREEGVCDACLSPELSLPQCRDIGGRVLVYGYIPLMLLERCFIRENFSCDACGHASFTDRTGARFPLIREYKHRNLLLNAVPTYMGDKKASLPKSVTAHFLFMKESPAEAARILSFYEAGKALPYPVRRVGKTLRKPEKSEAVQKTASPAAKAEKKSEKSLPHPRMEKKISPKAKEGKPPKPYQNRKAIRKSNRR